MPSLVIERGREKGASFELAQGSSLVVGRDPATAQLVISDPAASRRHFQVGQRNGKWVVSDLGSKNATFVNDDKLEREREIGNGDRIQVGETVFSFIDEERTDKSATSGLNGKEIGGYRILERIGRGGMGTVFKARQISLNRIVALKLLSSKLAVNPTFVEKFVSEARAAGQLNHPNVVQVFDVGQSGGLYYFSMEFMEGGCVQDLLTAREDGRLHWTEALPMVLDASRGLVFAEKRGIIHRDIKPDNLMLTSEQRVKIGDLGLAKRADEEATGDKSIFGTPHFIAPEQAQGKDVTHAADLYALGASFYRMVSGRTPFSGATVKEILRKQITEEPEPIVATVPDFPPDLATIISHLMAKKVEERYQSATKLVEDLEAFQLAHEMELAGAKKANKPLMFGLAAVAVVLIGVVAYLATRPPEQLPPKINTVIIREPGQDTRPVKTPAELRREIEDAAKLAYRDVQLKDATLRDLVLDKKQEWIAVAAEYDAVAEAHPKSTEYGPKAAARASQIRTELDRMEREQVQQLADASDWWGNVKREIEKLERDRNWALAIRRAREVAASEPAQKHLPLVPEARTFLEGVEARMVQAATQDLESAIAKAKQLMDGGRYGDGLKAVEDWAKALRTNAADEPKLLALADDADKWVTTNREDVLTRLNADLDADQPLFLEGYRALRSIPRNGESGGSLFDYRFEDAAAQMRSLSDRLRTYPFKRRAAQKALNYDAMQVAWDRFIDLLAQGKVIGPSEEVRGLPNAIQGARGMLDLDPNRRPTREGFAVTYTLAGGAGSTSRSYTWADLTRDEIANTFVGPKVDKLPPDVALGLARMFAELGLGRIADDLLRRAIDGGEKLEEHDETALRREIGTLTAYDAVRAFEGEPADRLRAIADWRKNYFTTDAFVLLDGRPIHEVPQVITDEKRTEFLENYGVVPSDEHKATTEKPR